ncbi:MAG: helix-turn-helix domain-containing protein [archaeon]|nr:helix-turn-helix domain-containing protein [archaeon]
MNQEGHGRRYSREEKRKILLFLEENTYKKTSERFNISETTLARWRKILTQSVSDIKVKIIIGMNQYWLDYLNEKIANGVWENYDDAIREILRYYDKNTKDEPIAAITEKEFSTSIEEKLTEHLSNNPEIHSMIAIQKDKIKFRLKAWPSENIKPLLSKWIGLKEAKSTFTINFNNSKYILQASQEQAFYINIDNRKAIQNYTLPDDMNEFTRYTKKDYDKIQEIIDNDTFQREYILGIKVSDFDSPWYFFALIHKEKTVPSDIIHDFYKTIRIHISTLKNKK